MASSKVCRLSSKIHSLTQKLSKTNVLVSSLPSPIKSSSPSPFSATTRINQFFRLPVELSSCVSLLPLHSALASARLVSSLSVESKSWCLVPQGKVYINSADKRKRKQNTDRFVVALLIALPRIVLAYFLRHWFCYLWYFVAFVTVCFVLQRVSWRMKTKLGVYGFFASLMESKRVLNLGKSNVHEYRNQFRFYETREEPSSSSSSAARETSSEIKASKRETLMERESLKLNDLGVFFLEENMSEEDEIIRNANAWIITNIAAFVNISVHGDIFLNFN